MKRKPPVEIGHRMVAELYRLFPDLSDAKIARQIGSSKSLLSSWKEGRTPSAIFLSEIHRRGGDVIYILTGGRGNGK